MESRTTEPRLPDIGKRPSIARTLFHRAVPAHIGDPFGLAGRLISSGKDGRFAMYLAGLHILATPIDLLLAVHESRLYKKAARPMLPIVFVCGPPRSGTTVVTQVLTGALPVTYFTNFTALFPRAPLTASRLFRIQPRDKLQSLRSHYGRTAGFSTPNDALHLWDRWLGSDRTTICRHLADSTADTLVKFFGAFENWTKTPLLTKNNNLNAHASLVAEYLPTARFICLQRDPIFLAQSLLIARRYIHGDDSIPYGIHHPHDERASDPIVDVCRQVRFHQLLTQQQLKVLGPERFLVVSYEDFCRSPRSTVEVVARDILHVPWNPDDAPESLQPSRSQRVPKEEFQRLEKEIEGKLGL